MSQHLQRLAVRMLYDSALVAQIYGGQPVEGLSAADRALLTAGPRTAWGTDPLRCTRTLQALLEEYSVSAAVTGLPVLHGFFSAPEFHGCIQQRGRLSEAFGHWLEPRAGRIAVLERSIAQSRRDDPAPSGVIIRAPGLVPVSLPADTLQIWQQIRAQLGAQPLRRLVSKAFQPVALPPPSNDTAHWLIERGPDGDVRLGGGSAALNGLLSAAPAPRAALLQTAVMLGASTAEAGEIIDDLLQEGLLEEA